MCTTTSEKSIKTHWAFVFPSIYLTFIESFSLILSLILSAIASTCVVESPWQIMKESAIEFAIFKSQFEQFLFPFSPLCFQ